MTFVIAPGLARRDDVVTTEGTMSETLSLTNRTVGEIASSVPAAIRIFESWKIDYCCGGSRSIGDACASVGKTVDELIAAIDAAPSAPEGAAVDWDSKDLVSIAKHICDYYHRYTREELATLESLAAKVYGVHGERNPELEEVEALVRALATDMLPHMLKEEQVLFPYVEELEEAARESRMPPTPFFGTVKNPVQMMMMEHDRVGELLARLRAVTRSYTLPPSACFSYTQLYGRLVEFEKLTHEHVHIENNVYFPRAVGLEERAGAPAAFATANGSSCCGGH